MLLEFLKWMFINIMVALGLVFLAAYPPMLRRISTSRGLYWREVTAASFMSVFCMFYPWVVGPGQYMDIRMVPLGLVGWRYGTAASAVVGAVIIAVRYVMGGKGVITTVFFTLACVALVPLFRHRPRNWKTLMALGVAQAVAGYAVGQALVHPQPPGLEYYSPFWLVIGAVQIAGMWVINAACDHVAEKQRLQRSLFDTLQSQEAVLELMPHGILFVDNQGRITESNHAARAILESEAPPEAILTHPGVARAISQRIRVSGCRVTIQGREGCERIILVSALPLQGGCTVIGLENVTKVIRQEREEARRDRLELLGRMSAMAAHEIRNPLTTIKGFLQLLSGKPEFAAHRSTLGLVQGEVEHINRVVGDFLELSGNSRPQVEPLPVDAIIDEVRAAMELQFPESPVEVELTGEPGLLVMADRKALKQILRNLMANAFEAMPLGGRVTLRRERTPEGARITVTDTGPGISGDVLEHIFTPYTTTKTTGTGLGLAISHKLAVDMGAQLTVDSSDGRGCTFRLSLPVETAQVQAAAAELEPGQRM